MSLLRTFGITSWVVLAFAAAVSSSEAMAEPEGAMPPALAEARFAEFAKQIDTKAAEPIPVQSQGRVKPLDTFARETLLFLTGKYTLFGLSPVQELLAIPTADASPWTRLINVRSPELRTRLGLPKEERRFSLAELEQTQIEALSQPLLQKQEQNSRAVSPEEKLVLEAMQQVWLMRSLVRASPILEALNLDHTFGATHSEEPKPVTAGKELIQAFGAGKQADFNNKAAALDSEVRSQRMPGLFREQLERMGLELFYNKARLFFWTGLTYLLLGIYLASGLSSSRLKPASALTILALPLAAHLAGFAIRVWITGFAPVTNMYGTMVWVSFGIVLFGSILYWLYGHQKIHGLVLSGAGLVLLLTESIPLVLSPDLNPVVAVLRSNFWLTIHVLTITISYAAFTVAMLLGNYALIQFVRGKPTAITVTELSKLAYRVIQLGVFLLTVGIILGGWWADYSWGRFWGWDPKETWALIADLGFLAILHAKYLGWLGPFGLLASAPLAYLLVIMAWYGVNFILAAGLHSYGFSSGGATIVAAFVLVQLLLAGAAWLRHSTRSRTAHSQ